ncbi:unnamed protein product [Urochloa decumbens]|uniref:NAC domain-containing protein n=1 Tax=Urochloa decumbens TaxID=240449 RepID=A0ABC8Z403_9POAL
MVVSTRRQTAGPGPRQPVPDLEAHPSEEELIASFLRPCAAAVASGAAPPPCAPFVHDADVYSADPAELTAAFAPAVAGGNGDEAWYFLSAVRAKTRDGQRKARTVDSGEGCWHSEAGAKPVVDDAGRCLGHRQSFSFVTKVDGRRVRSGWLMVELGLDGDDAGVVLCKIYFSPRARVGGGGAAGGRKRKAAAAGDRNNPARQQRRRTRPTAEAGASLDDDGEDDDGEEEESTHGGGMIAEESSAAGGQGKEEEEELWTDDSFFSWWMRNRMQLMEEYGIVDRSDEEILEATGFDKVVKALESNVRSRYPELPTEEQLRGYY